MVAVHLKRDAYDVRVDRQTRWGNPFPMKSEADRDRVIAQYRTHLAGQIRCGEVTLDELALLHGKRLGCWCAPRACHADVLTSAAAWAKRLLEEGGS